MKKFNFVLFIFIQLLIFDTTIYAQNNGYLGQKNIISFQGIVSVPLLYNLTGRTYEGFYGYTFGKDPISDLISFDGGVSVSYTRLLSEDGGVGFEYVFYQSSLLLPYFGVFDYNANGFDEAGYYIFEAERLKLQTMSYMPKVEFGTVGNTFPLGINNQIGVGYTSTKVLTKDVFKANAEVFGNFPADSVSNYFDYEKVLIRKIENVKGLMLMYHFNLRIPMSKQVMINLGLRYTLNYTFGTAQDALGLNYQNNQDYYIPTNDIMSEIRAKRFRSAIAFNLGINYCF